MFKKMISKMRNYLLTPTFQELQANSLFGKSSVEQKILTILYKQLYDARRKPLSFKEVSFRAYSQSEEDGIILFIFSLIGTTNRRCVEVCCGDGIECNTANLIVNHGWIGLLCDGKEKNIKKANRFYSKNPDTKLWPPRIVKEWITKDNVNQIFEQNGFAGEIDLLSVDIDGVDYWLWKQVSCVSPRVVVVEFNHLWGPDRSVTVPYRDDFVGEFSQYGSDYAGASLKAFVKLGRDKGYRLVGTNAIATNAFFIRDDIVCDWLGEIEPSSCFDHPRVKFGMAQRLPNIKDKEWVEV